MTDPAVAEAIAKLEPGTEVVLKLADGRTLEGTLSRVEGDSVQIADEDAVGLADVVDFGEVLETDGPE